MGLTVACVPQVLLSEKPKVTMWLWLFTRPRHLWSIRCREVWSSPLSSSRQIARDKEAELWVHTAGSPEHDMETRRMSYSF